jgi:hypothetical protein
MRAASWKFLVVTGLLSAAPAIGSAEEDWRGSGSRDLLSPLGEYVLLGGGVTDFRDSAVRDRFGTGATWDARLGIGSRFYVGGELAYVGSNRSGTGAGPDLTANGAEGVLRLQYPATAGSWLIEPFVFGGFGWSHLSLSHAPAAGLDSSDDVGVVPFGGGITVGRGHFLLDARFTYRQNLDEDLRLAVNEGPAKLSQWAVGASVGYEF